ncbi:MAG: glycosyltransferase family 2 protein [Cytophagaceae bacterium]|nr:glycosyltransferase family 2 protein [Cytophagaceae bacterium]
MTLFFTVLASLLGLYTGFNTVYLLIWAIAGRFGGADDADNSVPARAIRRIAVLIPAYREDAVIVDSVRANLQQNYPTDAFRLIVIADSFRPDTLDQLRRFPIDVIEVSFENSSVVNSLQAALTRLPGNGFDIALVADADNHLATDFLSRVNQAFDQGWRAVQGHRVAKNTNTPVATLDAISEELNNHFFRKGHRALGFSSALIGSGMAFEYGLFKQCIFQAQTIGGYDKELDMRLSLNKVRIAYLEEAYIYDEKIQNSRAFENQRTRWIESQVKNLQLHFGEGIRQFFRGNFDYAEKVLQTTLLPRIFNLGLVSLLLVVALILDSGWFIRVMAVQSLLLMAALLLALPAHLRRQIGWSELRMVPVLLLRFCRSILRMRRARNQFLHTTHGSDAEVQQTEGWKMKAG